MFVDADDPSSSSNDEPLENDPDEDKSCVQEETEKGVVDLVAQEYRFYESSRLAIGDEEYKSDPDF